jgi:hypothetical protein
MMTGGEAQVTGKRKTDFGQRTLSWKKVPGRINSYPFQRDCPWMIFGDAAGI